MQNRDEGLVLVDFAVQLASHAKTNSAKTLKLSDKSEEIARASNLGECVAVQPVLSYPVWGRFPCLTGKEQGKTFEFGRIRPNPAILILNHDTITVPYRPFPC